MHRFARSRQHVSPWHAERKICSRRSFRPLSILLRKRMWLYSGLVLLVAVALGRVSVIHEGPGQWGASDCELTFAGELTGRGKLAATVLGQRVVSGLHEIGKGYRRFCVEPRIGSRFMIRIVDSDDETNHARALTHVRIIEVDSRVVSASDSVLVTVLVHELAHLALADVTSGRWIDPWYREGIAHLMANTTTCQDSLLFAIQLEESLMSEGGMDAGQRRALQLLGGLDRFATASAASELTRRTSPIGLVQFHESVSSIGFHAAVRQATGSSVADFLTTWADDAAKGSLNSFSGTAQGSRYSPACSG
jgi:hypothetical protein